MIALAICLAGLLLEALAAGAGVRRYLEGLKWPTLSPPLWVWYIIGLLYYVVVFVCTIRILAQSATNSARNVALALLLLIVFLNAAWNLLFFRVRNLGATFAFSLIYSAIVVVCLFWLSLVDLIAARALGVYAIYLLYANVWGYRLWRLNAPALS